MRAVYLALVVALIPVVVGLTQARQQPQEPVATFRAGVRAIQVDAVVTGSVVRSGDKVSITAQLVDPQTEEVLWTNRYDAALRDVISVQNQIVTAIVR